MVKTFGMIARRFSADVVAGKHLVGTKVAIVFIFFYLFFLASTRLYM